MKRNAELRNAIDCACAIENGLLEMSIFCQILNVFNINFNVNLMPVVMVSKSLARFKWKLF